MGLKTRAYAVVLPVVVFVVLWVQVTAHMRLYLYANCIVAVLTSVVLPFNHSLPCSGGALKVHNPPCDMSWEGGRFSTNVAADGGAMYLTEVTTRNISGSADYDNNKVREGLLLVTRRVRIVVGHQPGSCGQGSAHQASCTLSLQ
jgi:hypothetical protein